MESDKNKFMVRDSDQTKYYLWDAYEGYQEHFGNYIMYERLGVVPLEITAGLYKYLVKFYYQIYKKVDEFEKIQEEDIKKYKKLLNKDPLNKNDYVFIMEFIEMFMQESGVKNIVFETDDPGQSIKKNR
jgi:hypothetical protein